MSGVGPSSDFSLAQRVPMTDLEQTQSKKRRPLLQARVDDATEADFTALAARRGMSPSELLRAIVARELAGGNCQLGDIEVDPENADSRRMTIRIPSFAHQAVCARATRCGMKPSKWVAALVQSNVTRMPVFAENELRVLEVTNRELFAIGRNINQMSRVLNEAHFKTEQLRIEKLAELAAYIRKTRDAIRGLIRASRGVWRGEE